MSGQSLIVAVQGGASAVVTAPAGSADLLDGIAALMGRTRTRVVRVRPPLELSAFLRQVAGPGGDEVERGLRALTIGDGGCDRIALLVDDAHLMPEPTLRYLDFVWRSGAPLQVVMVGQAGLAAVLALPGFAGLRARFAVEVAVMPTPLAPVATLAARPVANDRLPVQGVTPWRLMAGAAVAACVALAIGVSLVPARPDAVAGGVALAFEAVPAERTDVGALPDAAMPVGAVPALVADTPAEAVAVVTTALLAPDASPRERDGLAAVEPLPAADGTAEPLGSGERTALAAMPAAVADRAGVPDGLAEQDAAREEVALVAPAAPSAVPDVPQVLVERPVRPVAQLAGLAVPTSRSDPAGMVRPVVARPAPARAERVAMAAASSAVERRCATILLRVQIGESPTDGERAFLRNGCR